MLGVARRADQVDVVLATRLRLELAVVAGRLADDGVAARRDVEEHVADLERVRDYVDCLAQFVFVAF